MRVILYTGKGGVGKTTLSAATAVAAARAGHRTIVMSIDAAHSLSDSLDVPLSHTPTRVEDRLDALEIDVHHELTQNWSVISGYLKKFLSAQGYEEVVAEELAVLPGMEELFSLLKLLEFSRSGEYDTAIIDCAPTGSTLQFLAFSDVIEWYMTRFFDLERKFVKAMKPIAERIIKAPLPTDDVFFSVEGIYERIMAVKTLLSDPLNASVRLVVNPEKMVIAESRRAYLALSLFGFPVDCVIANRLLPKEASKGYFSEWRKTQKLHLETINEFFEPVPVKTCRLFNGEVIGLDGLALLGEDVFGDQDPADVFHDDQPFSITADNGGFEMNIKLPGVRKDQVDLWTKEDELIITVDGRRRNLLLPRALKGRAVKSAKVEHDRIRILFGREG
jgi:arsenite/tail-anchored protein-transporting ATPase